MEIHCHGHGHWVAGSKLLSAHIVIDLLIHRCFFNVATTTVGFGAHFFAGSHACVVSKSYGAPCSYGHLKLISKLTCAVLSSSLLFRKVGLRSQM